jgi:beta-phosphoglucomutase-like phosphatase (HAD superfamily)
MSLRAIVFDFDGVIANSEPLHFQAFRDVLSAHGLAFDERDYYARYLGFDDVGVFQAVGAERGADWTRARIGEMVADKAVRLEALEHDASILFPGAAEAIRRAAATVPIAIASGARGDEIRRVLNRENLASYFSAIVGAEDTPVSKPAPDPYLHALALLAPATGTNLKGAECVAIEDSIWGLASARSAGLKTVAVTHTYDAAALGGADLVIGGLDALDIEQLVKVCSR